MEVLKKIEKHVEEIRGGNSKVHPGQEILFPKAASFGDAIWQGDLCLELVESIPHGFKSGKKSEQLVPGNTQGAKHCLNHLNVEIYYPAEWPNVTKLGPCFISKEEVIVEHPVHGNVVIPPNMMILCSYQREWDAERAMERRNAD